MQKFAKKLSKNENGQSLVEFALITPLVIFILLAVIEYGWMLNAKITLTSAAREGARVAAVTNKNPETKALNAVKESVQGLSGLTISDSGVVYIIEEDVGNNIRNVVIDVTATMNPLIGLYITGPITMEAIAVMRLE